MTPKERERVRKRTVDRKRQRTAKGRGEAVSSEEAIRRRKIKTPVLVGSVGEIPFGAIVGVFFLLDRQRRRLLGVLRARLRQMSP